MVRYEIGDFVKIIGLTGGIATGKSTVSKIIRENNIPIIDADKIYKDLSQKGNSIWRAIYNSFGQDYIKGNGEIDKKALSSLIFDDPKQREKLNAITHPIIKDETIKQIKQFENEGKHRLLFLDVPLLFEAGWDRMVDETWVVTIPYKAQLQRLMDRDNCSKDTAQKRIRSQMSLDEKVKRADIVIDNSGSIRDTRKQVLKHLGRLIKGVENL